MKRPPRQVWLALCENGSWWLFRTRKEAKAFLEGPLGLSHSRAQPGVVAGPYVLAERVRQK